MNELVIAPQTDRGRAFSATLVAYATANSLWFGGESNTQAVRPVWIAVAGSDESLRPFVANLITGRRAKNMTQQRGDTFEIVKSAGFQTTWYRTPGGTVATIFLPELFQIDPGLVDPLGVKFILLPSDEFLVPNTEGVAHLKKIGIDSKKGVDLSYIASIGCVFAAFLDRRTRAPLVPDRRFFAQLLVACLEDGLASLTMGGHRDSWGKHLAFKEVGTERMNLHPGVAFLASHTAIDKVLAEQTKIFFRVTHGTN